MKQEIMNNIIRGMLGKLNNSQLQQLQEVLQSELDKYFDTNNGQDTMEKEASNQKLLDAFIDAKRVEGCSEKSLKYYRTTIKKNAY